MTQGGTVLTGSSSEGGAVSLDLARGCYCRVECPDLWRLPVTGTARAMSREAARAVGATPCPRCRPGDPHLGEAAAERALQLLASGLGDELGLVGVAARLGMSDRHLRRLVRDATALTPQELVLLRRVRSAVLLLLHTSSPVGEVLRMAGFDSDRQASAVLSRHTGLTASRLRHLCLGGRDPWRDVPTVATSLRVRFAVPRPLPWGAQVRLYACHSIPGIDAFHGATGWIGTSMRLPNSSGVARATVGPRAVRLLCELVVGDPRDLAPALARTRRWLNLDVPAQDEQPHPGGLPTAGAASAAGLRPPGVADAAWLAALGVLLEDVTARAAREAVGRWVASAGVPGPGGALVPPTVGALAACVREDESGAVPADRVRQVARVLELLASGADVEEALRVGGAGSAARAYVRLRSGKDPLLLPPPSSGVSVATGLSGRGEHQALAERFPEARAAVWTRAWSRSVDVPRGGRGRPWMPAPAPRARAVAR